MRKPAIRASSHIHSWPFFYGKGYILTHLRKLIRHIECSVNRYPSRQYIRWRDCVKFTNTLIPAPSSFDEHDKHAWVSACFNHNTSRSTHPIAAGENTGRSLVVCIRVFQCPHVGRNQESMPPGMATCQLQTRSKRRGIRVADDRNKRRDWLCYVAMYNCTLFWLLSCLQ